MNALPKMSWLELKLFAREPITVLFTLALPLLILYVLGGVFTDPAEPGTFRGVTGRNYYVPAYVGLVAASIGLIGLPVHLAAYRERGVLRRFRASNVPAVSVFGSQVFVALVTATVSALVLIGAAVLSWNIAAPKSWLGVIVAFVLSVLCFAAIGFLLGALLPTPRAAQGVGVLLWFVMFLIAGSGPPPEVLPDSLSTVANVTPLKHVIVLIQDPWLGFGWNNAKLVIVVAMLVVAAIASARWLRWD
ncbi:MAG TPA: ABC transporter permease [Jiangellaceae bacterium]|jgi:ABC-2 type transport system permease protein